MYAQKQFQIMDSEFRKMKKQSEFKDVAVELRKKLDDIQVELKNSSIETSSTLEKKLDELNSSFDKLTKEGRQHFQSGGNLGNVQDLLKLHDEKKAFYDKSNMIVKKYFDLINKIIEKNAVHVLNHYKDTKLSKIYNKKLVHALTEIKTVLSENKYSPFVATGDIDDATFTKVITDYNLQNEDPVVLQQFKGILNDLVKTTSIENNKEILKSVLENEMNSQNTISNSSYTAPLSNSSTKVPLSNSSNNPQLSNNINTNTRAMV